MAEEDVSSLLPASEFDKIRRDIINVDLLPDSWRTRAISSITEEYSDRARFYAQHGMLPEDVERDEERRVLPWALVFLLAALLLLTAIHRRGVPDCPSPEVVLGGCETY